MKLLLTLEEISLIPNQSYCSLFISLTSCSFLQDVTVIFRRRGGDDLEQSHSKWADTVQLAPDVINMTFTPIVSLLEAVPGIKHLSRAIELYLECKTQSRVSIFSYTPISGSLFLKCDV